MYCYIHQLKIQPFVMTDAVRREICRKYIRGRSYIQLAADYDRSVNTIKGLISTHLHEGKYRTLSAIRKPMRIAHRDERWKTLELPTKTPYAISSYGRIRNEANGKVLNLRITFGYYSFEYTDQELKKKKAQLVHILTAQHWLKDFDPSLNTSHIDHDKFNNYYRNLRQVTVSERAKRMMERGRGKHLKVTVDDVKKIKSSNKTAQSLATQFGVSTMQVLRIQRGDCWSHILPERTRPKQATPATRPVVVARIKKLLAKGIAGKVIAEKLDVTETTISRIKRGKTYREL